MVVNLVDRLKYFRDISNPCKIGMISMANCANHVMPRADPGELWKEQDSAILL